MNQQAKTNAVPAWGEEIGWTDANNIAIKIGDRIRVATRIEDTEYLATNRYWIVDNHSERIGLTPEQGGGTVLFSQHVASYVIIDNPKSS